MGAKDIALLENHQKDLAPVVEILQNRTKTRETPTETNWKRAFLVMILVIAGEWTSSDQLSRYVDVVRKAAGDEPADLMMAIFLKTRTKFMQDFMG